MISKDLQIEGLTPQDLARLFLLLDPPRSPEREAGFLRQLRTGRSSSVNETELPAVDATPALVLLHQGKVQRIVRLGDGALLDPKLAGPRREDLSRLRREHDLSFVVAIESEAIPRLVADISKALGSDEALLAQGLSALRVLQQSLGRDVLVDPQLLPANMLLPPPGLIAHTFERVLPDNRCAALYLFSDRTLWTAAIIRKREGLIDLLTGHQWLTARGQPPVRSVADARSLRRGLSQHVADPHILAMIPLPAWRRFVLGDRAAIAAAMATRKAVVDPCPRWLLALLGAGAVTEAASRSAKLAGRLLSKSPIGNMFGQGAQRAIEKMANPLESLGLDPWEAMRWGHSWTRRLRGVVLAPEYQEEQIDG